MKTKTKAPESLDDYFSSVHASITSKKSAAKLRMKRKQEKAEKDTLKYAREREQCIKNRLARATKIFLNVINHSEKFSKFLIDTFNDIRNIHLCSHLEQRAIFLAVDGDIIALVIYISNICPEVSHHHLKTGHLHLCYVSSDISSGIETWTQCNFVEENSPLDKALIALSKSEKSFIEFVVKALV